jgi:CRISPR/Cas system-associated exonuclease Cas4 (RecB family)
MDPETSWTSPSELADYTYCPRAHWYSRHPPASGPSAASARRSRAGQRYHRRVLTAERHRSERGRAYWASVLLGVVLVLAGGLWIWLRF